MRIVGTFLSAALLSSATLVVATAPAEAATGVPLGISSFSAMTVDQAHGHVFISDGSGTVLVRDLDGAAVTSITGLTKPAGMTLSDDGTALYVALNSAKILVVDTTTLDHSTLDAARGSCPVDVATTAGLLWVSATCNGQWGTIDAIDPGNGTVTPGVATSIYSPQVVASPALPDTLLWFERGSSPGTLTVASATGGDAPGLTPTASADVGSNLQDAAISPDGTQVTTASGAPYEHPVWSTTDLARVDTYVSDTYPTAVAYRPDGMVALGVAGIYWPDVYVYPAASHELLNSYDFGDTDNVLVRHGLAFGAERLYAVTSAYADTTNFRLQVITPRRSVGVTVTADRSTYDYGQEATVTVALATDDPGSHPVQVFAQELGGARTLVASGSVPAGGTFSFSTTVVRQTTFTAEYAGDAGTDPGTGSRTVKAHAKIVPRAARYTRKVGRYYHWPANRRAYVFGKVLPNHAGDCEVFTGQFLVNRRWGHTGHTPCVHLSSSSVAGVYLQGDRRLIPYPFRFRAKFSAANGNLGFTSRWIYGRFDRPSNRSALRPKTAGPVTRLKAPLL